MNQWPTPTPTSEPETPPVQSEIISDPVPVPTQPQRKRTSILREIISTALLVIVIFGVSRLLVQNVQVKGVSMLPTLQNNEYILVDTLSYRLHGPNRGDIIIFHPPPVIDTEDYVKRVIGIPGDTVQVKEGTVYINNTKINEPFITMPHTYSWGPAVVPSGKVFVLGDNRDASYDSHLWIDPNTHRPIPFLDQSAIIGRAMLSYWPLQDLQLFGVPSAFAGIK